MSSIISREAPLGYKFMIYCKGADGKDFGGICNTVYGISMMMGSLINLGIREVRIVDETAYLASDGAWSFYGDED